MWIQCPQFKKPVQMAAQCTTSSVAWQWIPAVLADCTLKHLNYNPPCSWKLSRDICFVCYGTIFSLKSTLNQHKICTSLTAHRANLPHPPKLHLFFSPLTLVCVSLLDRALRWSSMLQRSWDSFPSWRWLKIDEWKSNMTKKLHLSDICMTDWLLCLFGPAGTHGARGGQGSDS